MYKLIENYSNKSDIDTIEKFGNIQEIIDYLMASTEFNLISWKFEDYKNFVEECDEEATVEDFLKFGNVSVSGDLGQEIDKFKAGKVILYEMYNNENGESKLLLTSNIKISEINELLEVHGMVTTSRGVKNCFQIIG